jgi:hypothetical protein
MALGPLTPIGGLVPETVPNIVTQPGVVLDPSVMGGPANPTHGNAQWDMGTGYPVPWAVQQGLDLSNQPVNADSTLMAGPPSNLPPGSDPEQYADAAVTLSHGAPWPSVQLPNQGSVSDITAAADRQEYLQSLHGVDAGDTRVNSHNLQGAPTGKMPWGIVPQYITNGAEDGLGPEGITGNNHTGRDRNSGWVAPGDATRESAPGKPAYPAVGSAGGNLNRFGFDSAHVTRFTPLDVAEIPRPDDTMQGAQRPMVMNVPGRYQNYAIGVGSPFAGQVPGVGGDVGAAEIGVPTDYTPPPDAPTNPAQAAPSGAPVWGYSGLGY